MKGTGYNATTHLLYIIKRKKKYTDGRSGKPCRQISNMESEG